MIASIIITSYNYEKFLGRCIRSCLNQSINEPYEVIVVDDNSKDKSIKVASEFQHFKNFKILRNKKNVGVAETSNRGFKIAKGKYIVRIDADDYVSKNFLSFLTYYMKENSKKMGVACDYTYIDKKEKILKKISSKEKPIACGILYDKKKLSKFGYYNKKFRHREEEELRARIGFHYNIGHLELALYRYRMHLSNKTKSSDYLLGYKKKIDAIQQKQIFQNTKKIRNKGKIIAIIPARLGSRRFKNKNIYKFKKLPMIAWTIKAAQRSKFIDEVFVTSESKKILAISKRFNSKTILRPKKLSKDKVPKIIAIRHAVSSLSKKYKKIYLIVSLQANSPNITAKDIDICISDIINKNKQEVVSVDKNLNQNAAIRVMKYNNVFNKILSTHFSCRINGVADIHTIKDLKKIKD